MLNLADIQGDLLEGLPKNAENFIFFKIVSAFSFKNLLNGHVIGRLTDAEKTHQRELDIRRSKERGYGSAGSFPGLNLGFTKEGLTQLIGPGREKLEASFEIGADHPNTIAALNDPPKSRWLAKFTSNRLDGVFLVTGPSSSLVTSQSSELLRLLGSSIQVVYSELGKTRTGMQRGREHFGFLDGVSQPGIRGLTPVSDPYRRPDEGLPGQDLLWPGEFVFGYPGQDPAHPTKEGPAPAMAAPWIRNGSYMVFRRLEQKVPEFRNFIRKQAALLGMDPELLAARMVGRWKSGAPLESAPLHDNVVLGTDEKHNNDFAFGGDAQQRRCPYAAHIRKVYPRDDAPGGEAEAQRHRILRRGIPFGPEVAAGETVTRHNRGLMFVCYQTSIERQFEHIQSRYANNPEFVGGKHRPGGGAVAPGYDPIIGQAPGDGAREMDEPFANFPAGNRRTTLRIPQQFVQLTAAAYFFMPSISALRTVLT